MPGRADRRHDRGHEMVLHRCQPAAIDLPIKRHGILAHLQLFVLVPVVVSRTLEGIALRMEIGAGHRFVIAQQLRKRGKDPGRRRVVLHLILESNGVLAAPEHEGLGYRYALAIGPTERQAQFLLTRGELQLKARRRVERQLRGGCVAGRARQTRLQDEQALLAIAVEQTHRPGLTLDQWIGQQIHASELPAGKAHLHVQHVGGYVHERCGGREDGFRARCLGYRCSGRHRARSSRCSQRRRSAPERRGGAAARGAVRRGGRFRRGRVVAHPGHVIHEQRHRQRRPENAAQVKRAEHGLPRSSVRGGPDRSHPDAADGSARCAGFRATARAAARGSAAPRGCTASSSDRNGSAGPAAG